MLVQEEAAAEGLWYVEEWRHATKGAAGVSPNVDVFDPATWPRKKVLAFGGARRHSYANGKWRCEWESRQ